VTVRAKCNRELLWWFIVIVAGKYNRQTDILVVQFECDT